MMPLNLIGKKFGRLEILKFSKAVNGKRHFKCLCDCGNIIIARGSALTSGNTKSCGCFALEVAKLTKTTHGYTPKGNWKREYGVWNQMIQRCTNPNDKSYFNYGMRGIMVCEAWLHSFENFIADMGDRPTPKHTLDRIENNGNYCKENCRWATRKEQARNRRNNTVLEYKGEKKILNEWAEYFGVRYSLIQWRLKTKSFEKIASELEALI